MHHVTRYAAFNKHAGPHSPATHGVDVTSRQYADLVAAGWIIVHTWTSVQTGPREFHLADEHFPTR